MAQYRATGAVDVALLPALERSAGTAFTAWAELAWIADDAVMDIAEHQRLLAGGWCYVATLQSAVRGFVCAERCNSELHIWELAVHADNQGQGLGTGLIRFLLQQARGAGIAAATLTTFVEVPWNAPFYQRLGFRLLAFPDLDQRLREILAAEAAAGLPADKRCAMRLAL
ncbi:MAG: GNAT family N-acetyltransferase [Pseudomonadales bacterium]